MEKQHEGDLAHRLQVALELYLRGHAVRANDIRWTQIVKQYNLPNELFRRYFMYAFVGRNKNTIHDAEQFLIDNMWDVLTNNNNKEKG